jgi:hypothetical protein
LIVNVIEDDSIGVSSCGRFLPTLSLHDAAFRPIDTKPPRGHAPEFAGNPRTETTSSYTTCNEFMPAISLQNHVGAGKNRDRLYGQTDLYEHRAWMLLAGIGIITSVGSDGDRCRLAAGNISNEG